MKFSSLAVLCGAFLLASPATAGIMSYGLCQTGCNALYVSCCSAAGVTAGTFTLGVGTPAAVVGCTGALGKCMSACAGVTLLAPTP